ncbi:nucleotide sugar dehydrogenase [candidate division KSB1 bacterium]|nr:nucleotide sugar dehydrogenase [candidate division KSB1 bacterium]
MNISVFGMGYVGCVSAACLAQNGHHVIGVDVNVEKVKLLNQGISPVVEEDILDMIQLVSKTGALRAVSSAAEAILNTDISLVTVGTPSDNRGSLSTEYLRTVSQEIGRGLKEKDGQHIIVFRSTMVPGTTEDVLTPILEAESGKKCGRDFSVCYNPEFLREGSSIKDYYNPPFTIIGTPDVHVYQLLVNMYSHVNAHFEQSTIRVAEGLKYLCNVYHALKIGFANEVAAVMSEYGIDSQKVIEIFLRDTKLNVSAAYLRPGFAFGGSCLPKDLRAISAMAQDKGINIPIIANILPSNGFHLNRAVQKALAFKVKKIGLLGLAFKQGTDDLRESPGVTLAERLIGKGCELRIYDPWVDLARLTGANKAYIDKEIQHLEKLLTNDLEEVLAQSELLVLVHADVSSIHTILAHDKPLTILDLSGYTKLAAAKHIDYRGLCW